MQYQLGRLYRGEKIEVHGQVGEAQCDLVEECTFIGFLVRFLFSSHFYSSTIVLRTIVFSTDLYTHRYHVILKVSKCLGNNEPPRRRLRIYSSNEIPASSFEGGQQYFLVWQHRD